MRPLFSLHQRVENKLHRQGEAQSAPRNSCSMNCDEKASSCPSHRAGCIQCAGAERNRNGSARIPCSMARTRLGHAGPAAGLGGAAGDHDYGIDSGGAHRLSPPDYANAYNHLESGQQQGRESGSVGQYGSGREPASVSPPQQHGGRWLWRFFLSGEIPPAQRQCRAWQLHAERLDGGHGADRQLQKWRLQCHPDAECGRGQGGGPL